VNELTLGGSLLADPQSSEEAVHVVTTRFSVPFLAERSHHCKRYEDQRAAMRDIRSESSKKDYSKSVTELSRLEEKRFPQGVS
jgi:hypothetical protein